MATAEPQVDLECPVCHEELTTPKFLPCTHVICRHCVLSWLSAKGQGGCPLCRAPILTTPHTSQDDVTSLVDHLPTDLATMALVKSHQALQGPHVCSVCENDVTATSYCLDCAIKLCSVCAKGHAKYPAFRDHELEDLQTLSAERLAASQRASCDQHRDKQAELYCRQHQTLICLVCASSKHRTCSGVDTVGDMAEQARAELKHQAQRMRNREADIDRQLTAVEEKMDDTKKQFRAARAKVKATCDRLQQALDKQRQEIDVQLQREEDAAMADTRQEKSLLQEQKTSVAAHASSVERLVVPSPDSVVLAMLDKLKCRLDDLEKPTQLSTSGTARPLARVYTASGMIARLEAAVAKFDHVIQKDVQSFCKTDPVAVTSRGKKSDSDRGVKPRPPDRVMAFDPLTATPRRTFCVDNRQLTSQGDQDKPWISSLVVTNGKIVMADNNNKKVKVKDIVTPATVRSLSLEVTPFRLAVLHDGHIAVTSPYNYIILIIDVTRLRVVQKIKTDRKYCGVGCGGRDGTLIVSCWSGDNHPAAVQVIDRDGQVLRKVVDGNTVEGLRSPDYLCVTDNDVIVSDGGANRVYRVELATGRVKVTHTHSQLKSPRQVSADRSGNVYIASMDGGCVLVVGVDGRWRTLLSGKEHGEGKCVWPYCVTVTDTGVVVGWWGGFGTGSVVTGFDLK